MYQYVLTHEVLPGKLPQMKAWFKKADDLRRQKDPSYRPPKRYVTVYGNASRVEIYFEAAKTTEEPYVWADAPGDGTGFTDLLVPGRTEVRLLKELEL
jgi:hypothetical protein